MLTITDDDNRWVVLDSPVAHMRIMRPRKQNSASYRINLNNFMPIPHISNHRSF